MKYVGGKRTNPYFGSNEVKKRIVEIGTAILVDQAKKGWDSYTGTKTEKPKDKKSPSNGKKSEGLAGGRLKTYKKRRNARAKILRDGYGLTHEYGKIYTGGDLVGVGHITHPATIIVRTLFFVVLKKLLNLSGYQLYKDSNIIPFVATDQIVVTYQLDENSSAAAYILTIGGTAFTLATLVDNIAGNARPYLVDTVNQTQISFISIAFKSSSNVEMNPVAINMRDLMVKMQIKSTLKIQNRTVNTVTNVESNDIDNAPVYGRIYGGTGTGSPYLSTSNASTISFYGDVTNGVIIPTNVNSVGEPPVAEAFNKVTRTGKLLLNPGIIKTSTLTHTRNMHFTDWFRLIATGTGYTTDTPVSKAGKFAFMLIEKMIDASPTQPLTIATEHNLEVNSSCSMRKTYQMIRGYTKSYT